MLIKVIGIGLITIVTSLILKQYKNDFSILVNICGGLIIFFILLDNFTELLSGIHFISSQSDISGDLIKTIIKIIAAGYLTEFTADIADDTGNKFIASKILIGGKIAICVMAFPIVKTLFQTIISLI